MVTLTFDIIQVSAVVAGAQARLSDTDEATYFAGVDANDCMTVESLFLLPRKFSLISWLLGYASHNVFCSYI